MAITQEQFMQGLLDASKKGVGELSNALRDLKISYNQDTLQNLSDAQLIDLYAKQGAQQAGGFDQEVYNEIKASRENKIRLQGDKGRQAIRDDIVEFNEGLQHSIADIVRNVSKAQTAEDEGRGNAATRNTLAAWEAGTGLGQEKIFNRLFGSIEASNEAGVLTQSIDEIFAPFMGEAFSPEAQVAAEQAAFEAGGIPGGPTSSGAVGREGQTTTVRRSGDTYEIVGADGTVLESGLASMQDALARQTERQSGAYPDVTGAFAPAADGGTGTSGGTGTFLDGVDTSGLSDEAIANLQSLYTGLLDSEVGMELLTQTVLTDEDMTNILNKAREQITGSGSYYEQTFNRALETFDASLSYAAQQRELALAQERLQATMAKEQLTAGEAEGGRAFSGLRALSEERLSEQLQNVAESSELQFGESIRQLGTQAEDYLGSSALAGANIPSVSGQQIFTQTGGVRGSLERSAETDVQLTADELAREEAIKRLVPLAAEEFNASGALDELVNQY
uniref:Uncharacterized protein n=1 Tax=viral metagenome TaxID=1070528 RepID=A0A6M3J6R0_9ZZZZ